MPETIGKIVFATNNAHKLRELRQILKDRYQVMSLSEIGCSEDIPETGDTLRDNAIQKARYINEHYGLDCFADDTGLMVDALGGEPGVRSARYASETGHDAEANTRKLLANLKGIVDRRAHFSTVIALIYGGKLYCFEGRVDGEITTTPEGDGGFGYDPVFRPEGSSETFAQMDAEAKNAVSHRGRAVARLVEWFDTHPVEES